MISHSEPLDKSAGLTLEQRRSFMKLPLEERRRRLAEQADELVKHYDEESEKCERLDWQTGDIVEY